MTSQQVEANAKYRQKIFDQYVEHGASAKVAAQRAEKAALKYASKQHRYRAETIVHTELAFAYNQGAHVGVLQAINAGFMGRCAMVWTTAGTNRVCPRCLALKGTIVGHTNESGVTLPPIHPRCRCTIEYREIEPPKVLTTTQGNGNVSTSMSTENYRQITSELPYKPVSQERYNQLIIPLKKMDVTIHRDEETERHLDFLGVEADTIGTHDVLFRQKVSVSAILEETHHIRQNRRGMNDDKEFVLRNILNEIDAKKYLLSVASKYDIPREEIEATKIQLEEYEEDLKEYYRRQGGD